jgi:hypothetical protein
MKKRKFIGRFWPEWTKYQPGQELTMSVRLFSEMRCQQSEMEEVDGNKEDYPLAAKPPKVYELENGDQLVTWR